MKKKKKTNRDRWDHMLDGITTIKKTNLHSKQIINRLNCIKTTRIRTFLNGFKTMQYS